MDPNRIRVNWRPPAASPADHYSSGTRMDARRTVRYALEIDVRYAWTERGVERESRGRTRDMSPKGAFVVGPVCPPHGSKLTMSFFMPTMRGDSQSPQVQAESQVSRVDSSESGKPTGFSVTHVRTILCAQ